MTYLLHADFRQLEIRTIAQLIEMADTADQALDEHMEERDVHLQALDAFMDDRLDLLAELHDATLDRDAAERCSAAWSGANRLLQQEMAMRAEGSQIIGAENAQLRQENDGMTEVLLRNAEWMQSVREGLSRLGITVSTDELGMAALSVDLVELANSVERIVGRPA